MPKLPDVPSPWLAFFRQVRVLAEKLDSLEAEEDAQECRDSART